MKRNDRTEYNDYFDFVDFFNLIKNACSSGIYAKDIFVELTFYIYKLANHSPNSDKDDMNDLLKKEKLSTLISSIWYLLKSWMILLKV